MSGFFKAPPYSPEYSRKVSNIVAAIIMFVPTSSCGILAAVMREINNNDDINYLMLIILFYYFILYAIVFAVSYVELILNKC